jgi:hypothetical protein
LLQLQGKALFEQCLNQQNELNKKEEALNNEQVACATPLATEEKNLANQINLTANQLPKLCF